MRIIEGAPPEREKYGNKAFSLWWLNANGFPVPPGILVANNWLFDGDELRRWVVSSLGEPTTQRKAIVRSSGLREDSTSTSGAGLFASVAGIDNWDSLASAIERVQSSGGGQRIAAIVQKQVNPSFAGVIFPTDPISGNRQMSLVEVGKGFGGPLLDGTRQGKAFFVRDDGWEVLGREASSVSPEMTSILARVSSLGRSIEQALGCPCDIEWAIDEDDSLWALQVRPVVGGRYNEVGFWAVDEQFSEFGHEAKVKLRILARELGIRISRAWIVKANTDERLESLEKVMSQLPSDMLCSFVVIEPSLTLGKVLRRFGYSSDALSLITSLLHEVSANFWKATIIIKEVYDAEHTGIATRDGEGYWLEIARGHYVPKGLVETSSFRFSRSREVSYERSTPQSTAYHPSPDGAQIVSLDQLDAHISMECLHTVIETLEPMFDKLEGAIEFGIGRNCEVFLLDYVPLTGESRLDEDLAKSGVVSRGRVYGRLIQADDTSLESLAADWHARNEIENGSGDEEAIIVASKRPYISLMEFLRHRSKKTIGFIFEEPAFLCHFAVQLRERGIAAIYCDKETISKYVSRVVEIDAETPGLNPRERLALRGI